MARILLIDEQEERRQGLVHILAPPHEIHSTQPRDEEEAVELAKLHQPDLIMIALRLDGRSGVTLLHAVREAVPGLPAILIVSDEDEAKAERKQLEASRADCLICPLTCSDVHKAVERALGGSRCSEPAVFAFEGMVGSSPAMRRVFRLILKTAAAPGPVLVVGERGTGKESIVRQIHQLRQRKKGARGELEVIRCDCISAPRLERLLFGYARDGFPGAAREQQGLFELPEGSALYLDQVAAVPPWLQTRILRALEDRQTQRFGEDHRRAVAIEFFVGLQESARETLLPDFYYLVGANEIKLPALRAHPQDIPELSDYFLATSPAGQGRVHYMAETMEVLMNYSWPGNVAELKYAIGQAATVCNEGLIRPQDLPEQIVREVSRRGRIYRFWPQPGG
jgi:DNA-binding NtrC family response regulator